MPVAPKFMDSSRLGGVGTLVDIKGLGIGESSDYASFLPSNDSSSQSTAGQ